MAATMLLLLLLLLAVEVETRKPSTANRAPSLRSTAEERATSAVRTTREGNAKADE
jgi:hypothetical protein